MSLDFPSGLSLEPSGLPIVDPRTVVRRAYWRRINQRLLMMMVAAGCLLAAIGGWGKIRAERQSACKEQLGRIGLAFHRFQEARDRFPAPAIVDPSGRPLLSWRVAILPYLDGGETLYREFHRDEPWDSPHNLGLVARMPAVFGCPSDPGHVSGMTPYRVIASKTSRESGNPMFEDGRGVEMLEITDGLSGTILVVESPESVPWTKPDDLRFEPGEPAPRFGSRHTGGFHVLLGDANVRLIKFTIDPRTLMTIITRDGGEIISDA